jgi:hypothetical protein
VLAFGAILDPIMKLSTLEYCYSKVDPSTCEQKVEFVKRKLYMLYEKYAKNTSSCERGSQSLSSTNLSAPTPKAISKRMFGVSFFVIIF